MKQYKYDHVWSMHCVVDGMTRSVVFRESEGWDMESGEIGVEFRREVKDIQDIFIAVQVVFYPHTSYSTMEVNARVVKEIK